MNITNLFSNINPREVIKNLPDAVLVVENDGRIIWANDKASVIFETRVNDLKGLNFDEIVVNGLDLAEKSYARRNSVVTGAFTIEGKEFFVEMNAKKYIEQYFITIRDITAMTNVLANAERTGRLNKEKNVMLAKLSNEIKSPIQSIIGFSQALLDGLGGEVNDKQNKYVRIINKNSTELLHFMDKFLEFAQAESSLFRCENQPFDLVNAIQTVIKIMNFGAFIDLGGAKEGLLHISKISNKRVEKVEDVLKLGQTIKVKVQDIDEQGKISLNMKDLEEKE